MKTIKEQAQAYYQEWDGDNGQNFHEYIITEERKRRLPSLQELGAKLNKWSQDISFRTSDFRDWLLSYDSEAVVEDEVKGEECSHIYSRAMGQPYPRLCVKCGKPESVKVEDITQPSEDYQAKYSEAMVIIKRQAGDLQLLRENNIELKQELSHEKTLGNSARSDMEEAQKETEYWKEGVYFVTGQNPMAHKTYEGALKEAMVIGNSKIFKLVATCERTINVKEV